MAVIEAPGFKGEMRSPENQPHLEEFAPNAENFLRDAADHRATPQEIGPE
ncbi:hypothetical protein [Methylorubrum extorquens]|nr:hypothetical protein [Methylorubrum extorquens]WIU40953.1 hypothetical protein KQ926_06500 [Methylorubrum extorquens]